MGRTGQLCLPGELEELSDRVLQCSLATVTVYFVIAPLCICCKHAKESP